MTEKVKEYFEILMEEMNGKFSLVLEGHAAIRKEFKDQIDGIKEEQQLFRSLLKGSHDELKGEIQGVRTELKEEIQGVRTELKEEIQAVDRKLTSEVRAVDRKLTTEIRTVGHKVNRASERESALGQKVEEHEDRIQFLERKVA